MAWESMGTGNNNNKNDDDEVDDDTTVNQPTPQLKLGDFL